MKKLILLFASVALVFTYLNAGTPSLTISKAATPVTIDGVSDSNDPWTGTWIDMTVLKTTNTTSDMTAKYEMMYDDSALYVIVQIDDPTPGDTSGSNTYERDCMEVFVGMDTNAPTADYKTGDYQFRQSWGAEYPWGFEVGAGSPAAADDATKADFVADGFTKTAQVDDASSYITEWALKWRTLNKNICDDKFNKNFIKFEIQAADNTTGSNGGRTQQNYWYDNSDNQWHNITLFGLVALESPVVDAALSVPCVSVHKTVGSVSNVYVLKNTLQGVNGNVNIYDITGRLVIKTVATNNMVDISSLNNGIFVVKSNTGTAKFVKK
jgi:hypothetical protein